MNTIKKYFFQTSFLLSLSLLSSMWMSNSICIAQSVNTVSTAYELSAPPVGVSGSAESKLHVFFTLHGVEQIASVEILVGSTQGAADVMALQLPVLEKDGRYVVVGSFGEMLLEEDGRTRIVLPWSDGSASKGNFVSLAAISKAQVKSAYAHGVIQK